MVYNILVNPLGRKLIFKQPRLRENLESCLLPSNCVDIIGAALHIIKIFIDDFIDDNEMISVLIYQVQHYFLPLYKTNFNTFSCP